MKRYLIKFCSGTGWFTCLFLLLSTICQARQDGNTWPEEKGVKIMKVTTPVSIVLMGGSSLQEKESLMMLQKN